MTKALLLEYNLQFFAEGPGGEKTEEATEKKLEDARKEGQVAKSKELGSSVSLFALFIILKIFIGNMGNQFVDIFNSVYSKIPELTHLVGGSIQTADYYTLLKQGLIKIILLMLPFLLAGFAIAFVCDLIQVKWKPTTKTLTPKLSKINPINGFKRIFSVQSLVELLKSIIKLMAIFIIVKGDLEDNWKNLFILYDMPLMQSVALAGDILITIGLKISVLFLVVAFADYIFQRWKFKKDMRMTKQEVKEEYKSTEGDPQIKGKIKRKMQEASQRRMMQNLPKADVVITNPTHYAVAVVYDTSIADAPIVLAKGADYMAQKIKEKARENNIEIMENKPLARSLYANVDIGEKIPPELFVAVAEILATVYKKQGKV